MILIADSGSTKTDWCWMDDAGNTQFFKSEGYNPNFVNRAYVRADLLPKIPVGLDPKAITEIQFYGAGCSRVNSDLVRSILVEIFPCTQRCAVENDLLGAARALLGERTGIAVILGTGMNSGVFVGGNIIHSINDLGFWLGNEGSGVYLGKQLLSDYLRGNMPENVHAMVTAYVGKTDDEIMDRIYKQPFAYRFCAEFSKFIQSNLPRDPYFPDLVEQSFCELFDRVITHYSNYRTYAFNCVGSVGFVYQDLLRGVVARYGMQVGKIIQSPLDGLVEFVRRQRF